MSDPDARTRTASALPKSDPFGAPPAGIFAEMEPGRRGEILDAAMGVFSERGYEGGSMRQIAERVGVSEPALYRHFPGKEALFLTLMRATVGRLRGDAFALVGAMRPETFRAQLLAAFADRRRAIRLYGPVLRTVLTALAHNPTFLEEYRAELIRPMQRMLTEKVAELDTAYGIEADEADRAARVRTLMALFVGYLVTSIMLQDEPDAVIAAAVVRVMGWEGLA